MKKRRAHKQLTLGMKPYSGRKHQGLIWASSDEDAVIQQIRHNAAYWESRRAKRSTVEKYCLEKGILNATAIMNSLIRRGKVFEPRPHYVSLTERKR